VAGTYSFIEIYCQFIEVCGDGVLRAHTVRKWCREFENSWMSMMVVVVVIEPVSTANQRRT
jgi:hypothetical protein